MMFSIYDLEPGVVYVVTRPFSDHYQQRFEIGDKLTFVEKHFLPYHGGHTIVFRERKLYLQEDEDEEILGSFGEYFAVHDIAGGSSRSC